MAKRNARVKLVVWFSTIKSRESTQFPCVKVACDILLESSQQGLQLCFRPHLNRRSTQKVMGPQSCGSLNFGNFKTPTWEFRDKKSHLDVGLVERHRVYYKGEGGGFPQIWAMVSLVSPSLPLYPPKCCEPRSVPRLLTFSLFSL